MVDQQAAHCAAPRGSLARADINTPEHVDVRACRRPERSCMKEPEAPENLQYTARSRRGEGFPRRVSLGPFRITSRDFDTSADGYGYVVKSGVDFAANGNYHYAYHSMQHNERDVRYILVPSMRWPGRQKPSYRAPAAPPRRSHSSARGERTTAGRFDRNWDVALKTLSCCSSL